MDVDVRRIRPDEWPRQRALRLRALADAPMAFGSTLADESAFADEVWVRRAAAGAAGRERVTFVAEREQRWVGLATGLAAAPDRPAPEVAGMFVEPAARGCGVVEVLLDAIVGWARDGGAQRLCLWVTSTNTAAIRAYTRYGFHPTGDTQPLAHTPSVPEVRMTYDRVAEAPSLRLATAADAPHIARLQVRAWQMAYRGLLPDALLTRLSVERREHAWRHWNDGHPLRRIWVAEQPRAIVGFVATGPTRDDDAPAATGEVYATASAAGCSRTPSPRCGRKTSREPRSGSWRQTPGPAASTRRRAGARTARRRPCRGTAASPSRCATRGRSRGGPDRLEELAQPMLAGRHRRVFRRTTGPAAAGQALDQRVVVRLVEEHDRLPAAAEGAVARRIDHAVQRRHPAVVGPVHHQVAEIDHERVSHRLDVDPRPGPGQDLQAARDVLGFQDGQRAVVGVGARPELAGCRRLGLVRIVDHAEAADVPVGLVAEEILRQPQREGEGAHEIGGQPLHRAIVRGVDPAQVRRPRGPHVGRERRIGGGARVVRLGGHVDGTDGEELLQVGRGRADAVREILLADADVAAALLRRRPPPALLVVEGQVEERARDVVHCAHEPGVDAVADDREESDVLAGAGDRPGHGRRLGGGAAQKWPEIAPPPRRGPRA